MALAAISRADARAAGAAAAPVRSSRVRAALVDRSPAAARRDADARDCRGDCGVTSTGGGVTVFSRALALRRADDGSSTTGGASGAGAAADGAAAADADGDGAAAGVDRVAEGDDGEPAGAAA